MENHACDQAKLERPPEKSLEQIEAAIKERELTTDSFLGLIMKYLSKLPQLFLVSIGSAVVILVGILSQKTGPQLFLTIFYMIPIMLVAWFSERWLAFIFSTLSTLVWLIADLTSGTTYLQSDTPYWNAVSRLGSLFILIFILSALKSRLRHEKEYSRTDFLTGTRNRRCFIELLDMGISRASRYQHPFTLVCIDLDNFKVVNDCFGHSAGDTILRSVARTIQESIRVTDTVARLGGDEFAILLPETGRNVAETILRKVQKISLDIMQEHGWPVTLSIGAVTFRIPPPHG